MTSIRRLYILLLGFEILPKTVSTKDLGARFIMSEPISAYLLDTEQGWVLLDCGADPRWLRDPALLHHHYGQHGMLPPVVEAQHELEPQLAEIGVAVEDIRHVILSHLHLDHGGYLKLFPHARISIQRKEWDYAFGADPGPAYIREDYDLPGLDWHITDGDWEVMPGLTMIDTRGHTSGHQSAIVDLPNSGKLVLAFDAGDLQENFDHEILPGGSVDDAACLVAIRRINRLVAELPAKLILFHDPVAIQALKLAPEFYD
jgi:N-acyl homoserine lactone hydrolase